MKLEKIRLTSTTIIWAKINTTIPNLKVGEFEVNLLNVPTMCRVYEHRFDNDVEVVILGKQQRTTIKYSDILSIVSPDGIVTFEDFKNGDCGYITHIVNLPEYDTLFIEKKDDILYVTRPDDYVEKLWSVPYPSLSRIQLLNYNY